MKKINLLGILGIVFITLKLMGYISWSWWWVLSPFLIGPAVFCLIFLCMFIILLFKEK